MGAGGNFIIGILHISRCICVILPGKIGNTFSPGKKKKKKNWNNVEGKERKRKFIKKIDVIRVKSRDKNMAKSA
jgi:hypothetical protein